MKTVQISLNSIGKVKSFVNAISQFEHDFDLISGRYVIDAKSIMGIFSCNGHLYLLVTLVNIRRIYCCHSCYFAK